MPLCKGKGPEELPADDEIPEADEEDGDKLEPGKQMPKNNGGAFRRSSHSTSEGVSKAFN